VICWQRLNDITDPFCRGDVQSVKEHPEKEIESAKSVSDRIAGEEEEADEVTFANVVVLSTKVVRGGRVSSSPALPKVSSGVEITSPLNRDETICSDPLATATIT
jgi:hypothetical protein